MRLYIPILMILSFLVYILYLAFLKKELKQQLTGVLYPGLFFMGVWIFLYYFILF
jgi:hypothetical protein